jgi:hypothetical protein
MYILITYYWVEIKIIDESGAKRQFAFHQRKYTEMFIGQLCNSANLIHCSLGWIMTFRGP